MLHVDHPARRQGKSEAHRRDKEYCRQLGGELVSVEEKDGLRTETYRLPDGRRWLFVSALTGNGASDG